VSVQRRLRFYADESDEQAKNRGGASGAFYADQAKDLRAAADRLDMLERELGSLHQWIEKLQYQIVVLETALRGVAEIVDDVREALARAQRTQEHPDVDA